MALFKLFLSICFFRGSTERVPVSFSAFSNALFVYFSVSTVLKGLIIDPIQAILQTVCEVALMFVFILVLLLIARRGKQLLQTMTTLLACASIIGVFAFPSAIWLNLADKAMIWLPFYSLFIFAAWGLAIVGFILKQALARNPVFSFRLACVFFVQTYVGSAVLLVI